MTYSAWAPLAGYTDLVLLVVRIILGGTMAHYGWPKVKDPRTNAEDIAAAGFRLLLFALALTLLAFGAGAYAIV